LPQLATTLNGLLTQRADAARQIEEMLDTHPLAKVLTSGPGIGVRTEARICSNSATAPPSPTSGHLAAYAGLAPVTRRSGTSLRLAISEGPQQLLNRCPGHPNVRARRQRPSQLPKTSHTRLIPRIDRRPQAEPNHKTSWRHTCAG
jgi:transposase